MNIPVKNYDRDIRPTFPLFNSSLYLVLTKTERIFMEMFLLDVSLHSIPNMTQMFPLHLSCLVIKFKLNFYAFPF